MGVQTNKKPPGDINADQITTYVLRGSQKSFKSFDSKGLRQVIEWCDTCGQLTPHKGGPLKYRHSNDLRNVYRILDVHLRRNSFGINDLRLCP